MFCKKCKKEIMDGSVFCNFCGTKQIREKSTRRRGNGQGTVFKDKNGTWVAECTIGWDEEDGRLVRRSRRKRGFATKNEALAYIPKMRVDLPQQDMDVNFKDLFAKWIDKHSEKVSKSTVNCYKAAYKYFTELYYVPIAKIKTDHMQQCIDDCPNGVRTKQNMKALCTALWDYAAQLDIVDKNYGKFIYVPKEEEEEKIFFTKEQMDIMWKNVDKVPDIKYVLVLCYTGLRITEFVGALSENYNKEKGYFVAGIKSAAGKNRIVTISPRIKHFFDDFAKGKYLFVQYGATKFRNKVFYPALQALDLDLLDEDGEHIYTPHCCRHTFATMMKDVVAPANDKKKLIGHSKYEMTAHYTHTDLDSLRKITDNL